MAEALTEIYLVRDLSQAFRVAHELGALGIGLDVEGVLRPYIGNEPTIDDIPKRIHHNERVAIDNIVDYKGIAHGLMTNNTNTHFPGHDYGLVDSVASTIGKFLGPLPFVHKGLILPNGTIVEAKPSGHQGKLLAEMLDIDPLDMVLIDDQGIKNAGEAVKAGFKAIIVPDPIGYKNGLGMVIEHTGVMITRPFEPIVYSSLEKRGTIARKVYSKAAGIDISHIRDFQDLRAAA